MLILNLSFKLKTAFDFQILINLFISLNKYLYVL
jgi:hypothetical protein